MMLPIQQSLPLASFTTLELGGPAKYLLECTSVEQLVEALAWAKSKLLSVFVLGEGSNVVVSDKGFDGLVILMRIRGIESREKGAHVYIKAFAGEPWDAFVAFAVQKRWTGLECLSGIPGLVGAAPIQNVGAYGQEVSNVIEQVEALNVKTLERKVFTPDDCAFGYRTSFFKKQSIANGNKNPQWIIVSVTFRLRSGARPEIRYPELKARIEGQSSDPSLKDVRDTVLELRKSKSMVFDSKDPNRRSAGSFFTNPVLSKGCLETLKTRAIEMKIVQTNTEVPFFEFGEEYKVPAAWLIEKAGFEKGHRKGMVGISSKHSLALVHHGGAKTDDLMEFAEKVAKQVKEIFGVALEMEPSKVGFE